MHMQLFENKEVIDSKYAKLEEADRMAMHAVRVKSDLNMRELLENIASVFIFKIKINQ